MSKALEYIKALDVMEQAINEIEQQKGVDTELHVYDDDTIGCKDTWSDCGKCSYYKDLNDNDDIEDYPCPFDKLGDEYIDNIEEQIKSEEYIRFKWSGCYYRCKLREKLNTSKGKEIINDYKDKIYKQVNTL